MHSERATRATMTIEEIAAVLGLARSTAYDLTKVDNLPMPITRTSQQTSVSRDQLETW